MKQERITHLVLGAIKPDDNSSWIEEGLELSKGTPTQIHCVHFTEVKRKEEELKVQHPHELVTVHIQSPLVARMQPDSADDIIVLS